MKSNTSLIACLFAIVMITGCANSNVATPDEPASPPQPQNEPALLSCGAMAGMTAYCGFKNPEDLVLTPDGKQLIVSEMGEFMLDSPGSLSLLDLASGKRQALPINWLAKSDGWGEAGCAAPAAPLFSPHGIDLVTLDDGSHRLLVVNHGGREAVEFFELHQQGGAWQLAWKGCAMPPGDPFINDVAALNDGGFFVTHMWNKSTPFEEVGRKLLAGEPIGWVYEWQPDTGFVVMPNSTQLMPNGIAVNADNTAVFVNIYMGNKTIKFDRASGRILGEFAVRQPDNITVDAEGNLWVASHQHDPLLQTCTLVTAGPCLLPFKVVKANPASLVAEDVVNHDGAPMGYSTVALRVGDYLYLGSAHGDRIVRVAINAPTAKRKWAHEYSMAEKVRMGAPFHGDLAAPVAPFTVFSDIHSIGAKNIGVYLLTSPAGHVLIDTGVSDMHEQLIGNIRKLGYQPEDIKILLATHAHFDHIQGHEQMRRATGARVLAVDEDAVALRLGKDLSPLGFEGWERVQRVESIAHGDSVKLGNLTLTAHKIPGHTAACTVWTTQVKQGSATSELAIFGCRGPNGIVEVPNRDFPDLVNQTRLGYGRLAELNPAIYLSNHPQEDFKDIHSTLSGAELLKPVPRYKLLVQKPWAEMIAELRAGFEARLTNSAQR